MAKEIECILTPRFRTRWVHLAEPSDRGRYGFDMLFPEGSNLKELERIAHAARKAANIPEAKCTWPFRDGNEKVNDEGEVYPEYKDVTSVTAETKFELEKILDATRAGRPRIPHNELADRIYDGCYCVAQVSAYSWEYKDEKSGKVIKRGVSFNLVNLMKVGNGEHIGGFARQDADEAFVDMDDIEIEMDEDYMEDI